MINQENIDDEDFDRWLTDDFLPDFIDPELPIDGQFDEVLTQLSKSPMEVFLLMRQAFAAGKAVPR